MGPSSKWRSQLLSLVSPAEFRMVFWVPQSHQITSDVYSEYRLTIITIDCCWVGLMLLLNGHWTMRFPVLFHHQWWCIIMPLLTSYANIVYVVFAHSSSPFHVCYFYCWCCMLPFFSPEQLLEPVYLFLWFFKLVDIYSNPWIHNYRITVFNQPNQSTIGGAHVCLRAPSHNLSTFVWCHHHSLSIMMQSWKNTVRHNSKLSNIIMNPIMINHCYKAVNNHHGYKPLPSSLLIIRITTPMIVYHNNCISASPW